MHGTRLAPALVLALAVGYPTTPLAAQHPSPVPAPMAAPTPVMPTWSERVSFHVAGGVLRHWLEPRGRSAPSLLLGASFEPERWIGLEAELVTASLGAVRDCPPVAPDCPSTGEGRRLITFLYGIRVDTPTRPLSGFLALRNGMELDGRYRVFELGAGAKAALSRRVALRLDLRHRWDYRFAIGGPVGGTAAMLGLSVSGGG